MAPKPMAATADAVQHVPLDDVDHAVDERHAGNEEENARGEGHLGGGVEHQRHRGVHRGRERRGDENDIVVESPGLHPLAEEESQQRGREDDAHGEPVAAEQPAERGVGKAHEDKREDGIEARPGNDVGIAGPDLRKRQAAVESLPAQGAQLGIQFEADRQRRDVGHLAVYLAALVVADRKGHDPLERRNDHPHSERLAQPFGVAHHTGCVDARPHQPGGILGDELRYLLEFRRCFHNPNFNRGQRYG